MTTTENIKIIVGKNVRTLRKEKNMTQTDLMSGLGYANESSISNIENANVDISIEKLEEISNYFNVSVAFMCEKHDWEILKIDTAISERVDAEQSEDIIKAAVLINSMLATLVPESFKEKFALKVYNILKPDKK